MAKEDPKAPYLGLGLNEKQAHVLRLANKARVSILIALLNQYNCIISARSPLSRPISIDSDLGLDFLEGSVETVNQFREKYGRLMNFLPSWHELISCSGKLRATEKERMMARVELLSFSEEESIIGGPLVRAVVGLILDRPENQFPQNSIESVQEFLSLLQGSPLDYKAYVEFCSINSLSALRSAAILLSVLKVYDDQALARAFLATMYSKTETMKIPLPIQWNGLMTQEETGAICSRTVERRAAPMERLAALGIKDFSGFSHPAQADQLAQFFDEFSNPKAFADFLMKGLDEVLVSKDGSRDLLLN